MCVLCVFCVCFVCVLCVLSFVFCLLCVCCLVLCFLFHSLFLILFLSQGCPSYSGSSCTSGSSLFLIFIVSYFVCFTRVSLLLFLLRFQKLFQSLFSVSLSLVFKRFLLRFLRFGHFIAFFILPLYLFFSHSFFSRSFVNGVCDEKSFLCLH